MAHPSPNRILPDDVLYDEWLSEIGMEQYSETFASNFTHGGKYLSRKRLSQVRLQDFPKMNITNYQHQKLLLQHIKYTLDAEYSSPSRRMLSYQLSPGKPYKGESDFREPASPNNRLIDIAPNSPEKTRVEKSDSVVKVALPTIQVKTDAESKKKTKISIKKRNSFDDKAWESINKLRGGGQSKDLSAVEDMRQQLPSIETPDSKPPQKGIRRRNSFDGLTAQINDDATKGKLYGNMALQFNLLQSKMLMIQERHLSNIKETIGCEVVNFLFVNDLTHELMLCVNERWYRVPLESGVTGYCILTGDIVNISDAYADHRFNENIDKFTGYRTKTLLCCPVRTNRGGGRVVGVLELVNKSGGLLFDSNDEDVLSQMACNFSDEMTTEFTELLDLNNTMATFATPILPSDTASSKKIDRRLNVVEASTKAHQNFVDSTKKYLEQRDSMEALGGFKASADAESKEVEGRRRERRRSFGEKLSMEIENNPELLHTRKG